jgi:hypothetical protein
MCGDLIVTVWVTGLLSAAAAALVFIGVAVRRIAEALERRNSLVLMRLRDVAVPPQE